MEYRALLNIGLLGVALASSAPAQSSPAVTVDAVMSAEQLRKTGVDRLTSAQRNALDQWLSEYTLLVIQVAQGSPKPANSIPGAYPGSTGGRWIRSKADNGAIVILEDGSMWEINSLDRVNTALWLPFTNVTILKASYDRGLQIHTDRY